MDLCDPYVRTYIHKLKLEELGIISLDQINTLMMTGAITKTGTLDTTFHKPAGEANKYVCFG